MVATPEVLPAAPLTAAEVEALERGARPARALRGASHVLARASVTVTNIGKVAGDEVVFLFHNASAAVHAARASGAAGPDDPLALKQLVAFERVRLAAGESRVVSFGVDVRMLSTVDAAGRRVAWGGAHELVFSRGHGDELRQRLELVLPAPKTSILLSAPVVS